MLFAGLQSHAERGFAAHIPGNADDAAGHAANMRLPRGEKRRMRTAVAHGHAEALARTQRDVGAHGAGRLQQHQRHQVRGDGDDRAPALEVGDQRCEIRDLAPVVRRLQQGAETVLAGQFRRRTNDQFEAQILGPGPDDIQRLREAVGVDQETVGGRLRDPACHGHRLGRRRGLVQQRGIGDVETGQVRHHLLIIDQGFQPALRDFGLIRGVGRIPPWILEDIPQNDRWGQRAVISHADERALDLVKTGEGFQVGQRLMLTARFGQAGDGRAANAGRYGLPDQFVKAADTQVGEHLGDIVRIRANMAIDKPVGLFQISQATGLRQARCVSAHRRRPGNPRHPAVHRHQRGCPAASGPATRHRHPGSGFPERLPGLR